MPIEMDPTHARSSAAAGWTHSSALLGNGTITRWGWS